MKYYMQQQYYHNSTKVRVYASSAQGGRKYMEDCYSILHYKCPPNHQKNANVLQHSFMFFGIFDGHGGDMAARYSRDNLCRNIIRQPEFWSRDDKKICLAIHKGFVKTQRNMLNEVDKWPKTTSGLPSTAGTTASVVFIMNGKYYTGHVGDSRIVLGRQDRYSNKWIACPMTRDHKPESPREKQRIEAAGGQVMNKSGVGRVVWNRPKPTLNPSACPSSDPQSYDVIPFLAVARALGDLWSLNTKLDTFVVSPEPDVHCIPVDRSDRCLILASDGLWNMLSNQLSVKVVQDFEDTHKPYCLPTIGELQQSHASQLLDVCMNRWSRSKYRADNTTVLTIMFDREEDDNEEYDLSDAEDSEITDSEEEIDPDARNRTPSIPNYSSINNINNCQSYFNFISDFYDHSLDSTFDDDDDLYSEKSGVCLVGKTIHEMNLKSQEILGDHESDVKSLLSQMVDKVAAQLEGSHIDSQQPPDNSNTKLISGLTDEQLAHIRFVQCSHWDPEHSFLQNNYNTVLTVDRSVLGFREFLSSVPPKNHLATSAKNEFPLSICKVVLHESQNINSFSTNLTDANDVDVGVDLTCDIISEPNTADTTTNCQAGLDLIVKRAASPSPPSFKCAEVVSENASSPTSSSNIIATSNTTYHQPLSPLDSNSSSYSYRLPKLTYKRKFELVSDLSTSIVSPVVSTSTSSNTDYASPINLVGHHFTSKRFCGLESTETGDYLSSSCVVKKNLLDCNKNQVLTAASTE